MYALYSTLRHSPSFTKAKTNWTHGGVTYQATNLRNSFENGASSKEIEIRGFRSKNTRERMVVIFFWMNGVMWEEEVSEGATWGP